MKKMIPCDSLLVCGPHVQAESRDIYFMVSCICCALVNQEICSVVQTKVGVLLCVSHLGIEVQRSHKGKLPTAGVSFWQLHLTCVFCIMKNFPNKSHTSGQKKHSIQMFPRKTQRAS